MTPQTTGYPLLEDLFAKAVAAAHPLSCLPPHLPAPPAHGRLILLAAGKAAGAMIEVAEQHYPDAMKFPVGRMSGIAVARHGYGRPTRVIPTVEAGHPVPDAAGLQSAASALELATGARADDLVPVPAEDPGGALVNGSTAARAKEIGLDPAAFLADNDSTGFFERAGGLLRPGPTFTNVNDFRAILVDTALEPARNP
jgi:hydroxypyruvate reductase